MEKISFTAKIKALHNTNDDTVKAMAERSTAALLVAGSIPARKKYLYGLQVDVPGLAVSVYDFLRL